MNSFRVYVLLLVATLFLTGCGKKEGSETSSSPEPDTPWSIDLKRHALKDGSTLLTQGYTISAIAVGDVTGDGKNDIVYSTGGHIFILVNQGDGKFKKLEN